MLQKVQEDRIKVCQLRFGKGFYLQIGYTTHTEGDEVSEAWFEHLLHIVRVLPYTLDRVGSTKMSLQAWRRCRDRREGVPGWNFGWQAPHDTTGVAAET